MAKELADQLKQLNVLETPNPNEAVSFFYYFSSISMYFDNDMI